MGGIEESDGRSLAVNKYTFASDAAEATPMMAASMHTVESLMFVVMMLLIKLATPTASNKRHVGT